MRNRNSRVALTIDEELGIQRRPSSIPANTLRTDGLSQIVDGAQRRATELMNIPTPDGVIDRVLDRIAPSPVRRERQRVDQEMLRAEGEVIIRAHHLTRSAMVHQLEVASEVFAKTIELQGEEEIQVRALEVADRLDGALARGGADFDGSIDDAVDAAHDRRSATAREVGADRIRLRTDLRQRVQDALADRVVQIVAGSGKKSNEG